MNLYHFRPVRYVSNAGITDARVNLALEEYVFRNKPVDDDVLLFYINSGAIIIGRNQNTIEEIAPDAVEERGIQVVRRISGGGAVYHDSGNLNFSVMTPQVADRFNRYDHFTRPVIEVLRDLGVPAELGGRNDILVEGRKISGNAQFASTNRMFSHGTLLFDSNLDDVTAMLRPRPGKVESKGVKSIRSRVVNISEYLAERATVEELRDRIIERIFGTRDLTRIPTIDLTEQDWAAIHELVEKKYGSWSWNFGENPASNVQRSNRFPAGEIDVRIDVQEGRIEVFRIFGDFMGRLPVSDIESRLTGIPFERADVVAALGDLDLTQYFGDVPADEALALFIP